jgi:RNA polymerase sigma-70 factor (ECF subfamily)
LRRHRRFANKLQELEKLAPGEENFTENEHSSQTIPDDRLQLIFTCCHPALAAEAQIALTLRTLCGLSTEEIARAFLVPVSTMAQRLVRAKQKIRAARIPYALPGTEQLPDRLEAVLRVVYLVFTEGYAATVGDTLVRRDLCVEAIRLSRLLYTLMPKCTEVQALLALMLLHDSRRDARVDAEGNLILLEDRDRRLWNDAQIREGVALVETVLRGEGLGFYAIQAAIAAVHAQASRAEETDWSQIVHLYDLLLRLHPSPVIELNRAVAIAMIEGPDRGLRLIDELAARDELANYHLFPAARADLLRRLGRWAEAAQAYREALSFVVNDPERRFLERRLKEADARLASAS